MNQFSRFLISRFLLVGIILISVFSCKEHELPPDEPDMAETVYIGHSSGFLYALDATTGTKKWEYSIEVPVYSDPTVANGIVYMASGRKLYAVDATTGSKKWDVALIDPNGFSHFRSVPTVANGIVYVSVADVLTGINKLSALDAMTGTTKWEFAPGGSGINSPTVANGIAYVGVGVNLFAVDALTGTKKWEVANLRGAPTNSSVVDGVLYTNTLSNIFAYDATTGVQKWVSDIGGFGNLTVENGLLFLKENISIGLPVNKGRALLVIDVTTGKLVRAYNFSYEGDSSPVAVNGIVYVGGGSVYPSGNPVFTLYAVDALTATEKWVQKFETPIRASPTVAGGIVFVSGSGTNPTSKASTIYALDALTGAIKWETSPLRSFSYSPYTPACVVTKKGVVYHSSDSGDQQ